ncbi:uncharacterized protein LOC135463713 isoform X1 [Liolophura sinensis]|uniref:uncharacterized protein LOC135463713 isoform X1 n=1 Tax=Liolophura sinensis TaxID=3198878 RepID=UPI0031586B90
MGSLERVQYKFASIIGELCSEPIVLSQFAVWLDLKLAEYKAKGSISLDCSGEKPEPPWMKGVLPSSPPSSLFEHKNADEELQTARNPFSKSPHSSSLTYSSSSRIDHSSVTSPSQTFGSEELSRRLSGDDIILIKDEPLEKSDAYPTNVFPNESGSLASDNSSDSRKRPSVGSASNYSPHHQQFSPKVRRLANTSVSGSPSSASNQSSIGGIQQSPVHDPVPSTSSDDPLILPSPQPDPASQNSWLGQVTAERDTQSSGLAAMDLSGKADEVSSEVQQGNPTCTSQEADFGRPAFWPSHRAEERQRFDCLILNPLISRSTARHVKAAVKLFERWIWVGSMKDNRNVEHIPPEELDAYLVDFFGNIQKPSGQDYTPSSLKNVRSCLELYLKEQGYGSSITKSQCFVNSQQAFKRRKHKLERVHIQQPR